VNTPSMNDVAGTVPRRSCSGRTTVTD
jgi:hypothetical protein